MEAEKKYHSLSHIAAAHGGPLSWSRTDYSDTIYMSLFIFHKHRGVHMHGVSHTHRPALRIFTPLVILVVFPALVSFMQRKLMQCTTL